MARNGSGVYSLPAGYLAVTGADIEAATHNDPLEDIETDMNTARPVVAGGTGADNAGDARTNLGLDKISDSGIENSVVFFDDGDATKKWAIELSGITTATTRTWTVPDATDTFVGLATTQTLTNKTLTAPTITGDVDASGATGIGGGLANIQTFTSSGTYTPSTGVRQALVRMVGGGGGGGAADSDATGEVGAGEGGASGAFIEGLLDVSGGAYTATITIGAAGTAGTLPTNSGIGVAGGDTVYDDGTVTWTAGGGNGGGCSVDVAGRFVTRGPNGGTATSVGATLGYNGRVGGDAHGNASASAPISKGGGGANSPFGSGGRGGGVQSENNSTAGSPASGYGAGGGGGAAAGTASAVTGGAGTAGFVIVYEYY